MRINWHVELSNRDGTPLIMFVYVRCELFQYVAGSHMIAALQLMSDSQYFGDLLVVTPWSDLPELITDCECFRPVRKAPYPLEPCLN